VCCTFLLLFQVVYVVIFIFPITSYLTARSSLVEMANAASKKAQKAQASASTKYVPYILVVSGIFFIFRFILSEFLFSNIVVFLVYSATYAVAYFGLVEASKNNSAGEYYFDAFCVNMVSQVLYSFFNWGWYVWYFIPGYAVYQAVSYYLNMKKPPVAATQNSGSSDDDDQSSKKKDKKSRPKMQKMH
jgi:hypothetical protein